MSGAIGQPSPGVPGGLWSTNAQGIASPQAGRPALSGGLQQMQMLHALRSGASMQQLNAMNPYTPRPAQFLPQALPNFDSAGQYRAQQDAARAQALAAAQPATYIATGDGGNGGGQGSSPGDAGGDGSGVGDAGGGGGGGSK